MVVAQYSLDRSIRPYAWWAVISFSLVGSIAISFIMGFTHEQSYAYVSSGVGCWGPNARVGSSNEIVILSLKND